MSITPAMPVWVSVTGVATVAMELRQAWKLPVWPTERLSEDGESVRV